MRPLAAAAAALRARVHALVDDSWPTLPGPDGWEHIVGLRTAWVCCQQIVCDHVHPPAAAVACRGCGEYGPVVRDGWCGVDCWRAAAELAARNQAAVDAATDRREVAC